MRHAHALALGTIYGRSTAGAAPPTPASLSSVVNRLWLSPGGSTFQDVARTTPTTTVTPGTTDLVASWTDSSGNGFHAQQTVSGSRPTRLTSGGILTSGVTHLIAPAISAFGGDFVVFLVWEAVSYSGNHGRYIDTGFDIGTTLMQPDTVTDGAGLQKIKASLADPGPPYGLLSTAAGLGTTLHRAESRRTGTTHTLAIDGGTPDSRTVTGSALFNGSVGVGARGDTGTIGSNARIREVLILAGATAQQLADMRAYFAARVAGGVAYS